MPKATPARGGASHARHTPIRGPPIVGMGASTAAYDGSRPFHVAHMNSGMHSLAAAAQQLADRFPGGVAPNGNGNGNQNNSNA